MYNKKNTKKIRKNDSFRILVTETLPDETPLIFSNDGFYEKCLAQETSNNAIFNLIFDRLIKGDKAPFSYTIPYQYKIRKNSLEFRRLSLLHPIAQWQIKEFYVKYDKLICYFCTRSAASIRTPYKIAGTYYIKSSWENINKYKKTGVQNTKSDIFAKHSSSYFAYKWFDKLYKFFSSTDFLNLEKKFNILWTMDVSKCFDSIYTHTMSWATKDKSFTKTHVFVSSTFGQSFDVLMQRANYNETNGIVIGPEVSRIFAEIIFQQIDINVFNSLSIHQKLNYGEDYQIRRYVDDIYIFAKDDYIAKAVYEVYTDNLNRFNLHVNNSKSLRFYRPFFTKKSRIIREVNIAIDVFLKKILTENEDNTALIPGNVIHHKEKLIRSFIDSIKSSCSFNDASYDDVASYIISVLFERIKKIINITVDITEDKLKQYRDVILVFLEIVYFFYSVSPSVNSSYKLGVSIILFARFSSMHLRVYEHTIKQKIFELSIKLFSNNSTNITPGIESLAVLEVVNILLSIYELGDDYLLPEDIVKKIFGGDRISSYFDLTSCLFYIRDFKKYDALRNLVILKIEEKIQNFEDIQVNTEKACLFLDALSCPYIEQSKKKKWIKSFCSYSQISVPKKSVIDEFLDDSATNYWFINWNEVDLLNGNYSDPFN